MNEESLKNDLATFKQQLLQVDQAIQASGGTEDLIKLRADLSELLQLTEGSLLSLAKSRLLSSLEEDDHDDGNEEKVDDEMEAEMAAFKAAIGESSIEPRGGEPKSSDKGGHPELGKDPSVFEGVVGSKCRVPYTQAWGSMQYHNALVLSVEGIESEEISPKVRVLFCNPTHQSMLPCKYYLDGTCKFSDEDCRFSHGHVVALEDLKEFVEPNYSLLCIECGCLAKFSDGLWYKGMVVELREDHKYLVKYDTYAELVEVGLEEIIPVEERDASDEEGEDRSTPVDRDSDDQDLPVFLWKPPKTTQALGQWEVHTKGVGSRLMARMGYILGQGLGKNGEGRAEPVPIQLLPPGKSLDKIMQLKEIAGDQDLYDVMKRQKKKETKLLKKVEAGYKRSPGSDVFDFINQRLGVGKGQGSGGLVHRHGNKSSKLSASEQISEGDLGKKSDRHINIQILKTSEEMGKTEREIRRLKQSLSRNSGSAGSRIRQKLSNMEAYLCKLQASEKTLKSHQQRRSDHKQLTIF